MSNIGLAYRSNPATSPQPWRFQDASGTTYSTALATIVDSETAPATSMSTGRWLIVPAKPLVQLAFVLTDLNNETAAFGVFGVRSITIGTSQAAQRYYSCAELMRGTVTAGAKAYAGGVGNTLWADTISISSAALPSTAYRVCSSTDDVAWLEFDVRDFENILVVGTLSGSTGVSLNVAESFATI